MSVLTENIIWQLSGAEMYGYASLVRHEICECGAEGLIAPWTMRRADVASLSMYPVASRVD